MKFLSLDQAIRANELAGRIAKLSPLCPWFVLDFYFILSIKTTFNLSKQIHYAELVNISTSKVFLVEMDNGFALTLFSKRS